MFRTVALFNFRNKQGGTYLNTYTTLKSNLHKTLNLRTVRNPLEYRGRVDLLVICVINFNKILLKAH
jgi:hypothetical protein